MTEPCSICGGVVAGGDSFCPECAHLLRWFRGYFAHMPDQGSFITPQTTFADLRMESLDWMEWLLEAEGKLDIAIPDLEAETLFTVGQFLGELRARGASWAPEDEIRLKRQGGCFRRWVWETVRADRP